MTDEFISLDIAQRAEYRRAGEDARDCFGVHGAERYARACAWHATGRVTSTETFVLRKMTADWYDCS